MENLIDKELDIAFDQGLLEGVLVNAPTPVKDALKGLIDGVEHYRQKYADSEERYAVLQAQYNHLTSLSAQYLGMIQTQREQMDQLLIESQKDLHKTEPQ